MTEWHVDRLDLADYAPADVVDDDRDLAEVRVRKDLSTEEQSIVAEYLRGLAAGVDPKVSDSGQFED